MPTRPADVMVVVPVEPKYAALKTASGEVVAAAIEPETVGKVKSEPPPPVPLIVIGVGPRTSNVAQETEPEQVTEVVATD